MHRLFIAIRPPAAIRRILLQLMVNVPGLRWQDEEQLHLTLRFVGEVERPMAEDLAHDLESVRFEPFTLTLAGLGRFDRRRSGVLWAGVAPKEPVNALAVKVERVCQRLGLDPEHRAYHPHITLARWTGVSPKIDVLGGRSAGLASPPFMVDRFRLYESHLSRNGAHYEVIAEYAAARAPVAQ